jgi:hypothetical protein
MSRSKPLNAPPSELQAAMAELRDALRAFEAEVQVSADERKQMMRQKVQQRAKTGMLKAVPKPPQARTGRVSVNKATGRVGPMGAPEDAQSLEGLLDQALAVSAAENAAQGWGILDAAPAGAAGPAADAGHAGGQAHGHDGAPAELDAALEAARDWNA